MPVEAPLPVDTWASWPPASDEPMPSTTISVGRWSRSSALQPTDSAAPPDSSTLRLDGSYVAASELVEQRPGEGVADDEQEVDALDARRVRQTSRRIEALGMAEHEHGAAARARR